MSQPTKHVYSYQVWKDHLGWWWTLCLPYTPVHGPFPNEDAALYNMHSICIQDELDAAADAEAEAEEE